MRVVIVSIVVSTLLAVTVLGAVSAINPRGVATWMLISVSVAAGLGAISRSVESVPTRERKGLLLSILRPTLSVAAGVATLLSTMLAGCIDIGGVPDWERCKTFWGTPTIEWPGVLLYAPPAIAIGVGYLVWWLFGRLFPDRPE